MIVSKYNKLALRMTVIAGSSLCRFTKKLFSFFHTSMTFPQSMIRWIKTQIPVYTRAIRYPLVFPRRLILGEQ
ncbi:uncharacterized protein EV154DRAFT_549512, partial [Mucor mucedo]|uniref:uncharacterized protein n=1 Tax=Mucor mucedo TaxID=29922 RepID=UPI00221F3FB0